MKYTQSSLEQDRIAYNRGCWRRVNGKQCPEEPIIATRDLHQVGYQDLEDNGIITTKTVWAPCGGWCYACSLHPLPEADMYPIGVQCPHGITGEERGIPVPNIPLVGTTAIVLETDI